MENKDGKIAAVYGAVILHREECARCKCTAIVLDGELTCCGNPIDPEGQVYTLGFLPNKQIHSLCCLPYL